MIGQTEVLKQVNNLIEKGFPRFVIITGQKGQGKTTLALEIAKKLNILVVDIGIKVDEIRDMIEMSYKQTEPIIYLIQNADKMSLGAKNSLLKVIEEPPNNAYFITELKQIENTLDTIKSRCQEIKLQNYSMADIERFMNEYYTNEITLDDRPILFQVCENKYQLDLIIKYKPKEFFEYVNKVFTNIYTVPSANSFKIAEKIDVKDTGEGYDLLLFWNMYINLCHENIYSNYELQSNCIELTCKYKQKLNITGINKQALLDMWILDIRKEWLSNE